MAGGKATVDRSTLYTIADFVGVIGAVQPAPQFFKNTLFSQIENYWGQQAAVDFYRGSSQGAPFLYSVQKRDSNSSSKV